MRKRCYKYSDGKRVAYGTMEDLSKEVNLSITAMTKALKTKGKSRDYNIEYCGEVEITIDKYIYALEELNKTKKALNKVLMRCVEAEARKSGQEPSERAYQKWYEWSMND